MRYLDMFKSSLNSALDRKYFLDRWISVDSLVYLLKNNYELELLNNSYIKKDIHVLLDEFRRKLTEIGGVDDVSS